MVRKRNVCQREECETQDDRHAADEKKIGLPLQKIFSSYPQRLRHIHVKKSRNFFPQETEKNCGKIVSKYLQDFSFS